MVVEDPRVERVARSICRQCGYDPDVAVIYGGGREVQKGPFGSIIVAGVSKPAWVLYRELAVGILYDLDTNEYLHR